MLINHLETEVDLYKGRIKDLRLIHFVVVSAGLSACPLTDDSTGLIQVSSDRIIVITALL